MTRISCHMAAWWPVMAQAERAGQSELLAEHVRPGGECRVNTALKLSCLVAGHGLMDALFRAECAPRPCPFPPALLANSNSRGAICRRSVLPGDR
jgi:hypothetical protein